MTHFFDQHFHHLNAFNLEHLRRAHPGLRTFRFEELSGRTVSATFTCHERFGVDWSARRQSDDHNMFEGWSRTWENGYGGCFGELFYLEQDGEWYKLDIDDLVDGTVLRRAALITKLRPGTMLIWKKDFAVKNGARRETSYEIVLEL